MNPDQKERRLSASRCIGIGMLLTVLSVPVAILFLMLIATLLSTLSIKTDGSFGFIVSGVGWLYTTYHVFSILSHRKRWNYSAPLVIFGMLVSICSLYLLLLMWIMSHYTVGGCCAR